MRSRVTLTMLALAAAALGVLPAAAQPYDVSWHTVDGGGGTSSGGTYVLSGTAGQPDAGGPYAGGTYGLHSGFWAIAAGGLGVTADLAITKTDGQPSAISGQAVVYTIVASNAGPANVTGATVTDTLPAALTNASWTCAASAGSACPASGSGNIAASVDLLSGGTATFTLNATIAPSAIVAVTNTVTIGAPAGVLDINPVNNTAIDVDTLTQQADLGVTISDSPDPVGQGSLLTYTVTATNAGPSTSAAVTLSTVLPAPVALVSFNPPGCVQAAQTLNCALAPLAPGASHVVSISTTVSPTALGVMTTGSTVTSLTTDPVPGNNTDSETTTVVVRSDGELRHGTNERFDLAALPGPLADEDRYRIRQEPYSSYEVVVDEAGGDLGTGSGPALDLIAADGSTVAASAQPVGTGPARSLRFGNDTQTAVENQNVRVRSGFCGTDCNADDTYRIRAYDTTYFVPRFNNSGTQLTVLMLQNPSAITIAGHVYFWSPAGALLATRDFTLVPKQLLVLQTAGIANVGGAGGAVTITHDGPYGALSGKAVALEPATGFSFDSPMIPRRR